MSTELRFRQVHLDFHTSEHIARIGADFDPDEFASTLEKARVNSVTCFARCHHGYIYYDTRAFPERRHPHLSRNLLREQIEACHARDIRVPIYVTVQWDHYTAERRPEWLCVDADGRVQGTPPYEAGFYRKLCVNSPYVEEFLKKHTQEMLEEIPVDGFFFDIVQPNDCSCRHCREGMLEKGLDPADGEARRQYGLEVVNQFKRDMTAFVRQFSRDCTLFYNAGHVGPRHRAVADAYTHWEIESLPSGGWGYLHFPLTARYARNLGIDCLGMTGKFHTAWGDFHSFKNPAALQFECFLMLALNAKCSIGDQLHPEGKICRTTYSLIGSVYSEVEKKEAWCKGAKALTDIGVLSPEEFAGGEMRLPQPALGAVRMLQEGAQQFEVLDSQSDFSAPKVLVLPDEIPVSAALAVKLEEYLAGGGALIASYRSGLNEDGGGFALKSLGVELKGEASFSPDFIVPQGKIGRGLPATEHVMYRRGLEVEAADGTEVLARVQVPYFERDWRHFCSHRHTPSAGREGYPAVVRRGRCVYFAHPLFSQHAQNAPRWCKQLLLNALDILLPEPLVRVGGPSTIVTALSEQEAEKRWVLHLLHYIPERRGQDFDVIEDVIPVYDVQVSVRAPNGVKAVARVPEEEELEFTRSGERLEFALPRLEGHQMIALTLA